MRQDAYVGFSELRFLEVQCGGCGTVLISDLRSEKGWVPHVCSGCNAEFGDAFTQGVRQFKEASQLLNVITQQRGGPSVGFKLPVKEKA